MLAAFCFFEYFELRTFDLTVNPLLRFPRYHVARPLMIRVGRLTRWMKSRQSVWQRLYSKVPAKGRGTQKCIRKGFDDRTVITDGIAISRFLARKTGEHGRIEHGPCLSHVSAPTPVPNDEAPACNVCETGRERKQIHNNDERTGQRLALAETRNGQLIARAPLASPSQGLAAPGAVFYALWSLALEAQT